MITNFYSAQAQDQEDTTRWRHALSGVSLGYRNLSPAGRLERREARRGT